MLLLKLVLSYGKFLQSLSVQIWVFKANFFLVENFPLDPDPKHFILSCVKIKNVYEKKL